jgi:tetratricopeptide (TPR) repeat protein
MRSRRIPYAIATAVAALAIGTLGPTAAAAPTTNSADAIVDGIMDRLVDNVDLHWHEGEYNHIVNLYRVVTGVQTYRMDGYANAAWLLWSMDRDEDAVDLLQTGLKANPNTYYMYDEIANYYRIRKKDFVKAAIYFEKACRYKDRKPATLHGLAVAYEKTNRLEKALAIWKQAAKIPGDALARARVTRVEAELAKRRGSKQP